VRVVADMPAPFGASMSPSSASPATARWPPR